MPSVLLKQSQHTATATGKQRYRGAMVGLARWLWGASDVTHSVSTMFCNPQASGHRIDVDLGQHTLFQEPTHPSQEALFPQCLCGWLTHTFSPRALSGVLLTGKHCFRNFPCQTLASPGVKQKTPGPPRKRRLTSSGLAGVWTSPCLACTGS